MNYWNCVYSILSKREQRFTSNLTIPGYNSHYIQIIQMILQKYKAHKAHKARIKHIIYFLRQIFLQILRKICTKLVQLRVFA